MPAKGSMNASAMRRASVLVGASMVLGPAASRRSVACSAVRPFAVASSSTRASSALWVAANMVFLDRPVRAAGRAVRRRLEMASSTVTVLSISIGSSLLRGVSVRVVFASKNLDVAHVKLLSPQRVQRALRWFWRSAGGVYACAESSRRAEGDMQVFRLGLPSMAHLLKAERSALWVSRTPF